MRKTPLSSLTALTLSQPALRKPGGTVDAPRSLGLDAAEVESHTGERLIVAPPRRTIGGRYVVRERITTGGMGRLWRATDQRLDRDVVLKLLRLDVDGDAPRARFETEARTAASLRSKHIVELHDVGLDEGVPFLVFEWLDGEDLADRLERRGHLQPAECASIAHQTARGLGVAHRAGIVHRDIKPANLFLARNVEVDAEVVKILDFGVAKILAGAGESETLPGLLVGSPTTMSPEQITGDHPVDARSDLFSLACVLYRCLLGRSAFRADDVPSTLALVARGAYDPPSRVAHHVPKRIDDFFARALAVDPDARFATASELASAFEAAVLPTGPARSGLHL